MSKFYIWRRKRFHRDLELLNVQFIKKNYQEKSKIPFTIIKVPLVLPVALGRRLHAPVQREGPAHARADPRIQVINYLPKKI